MLMLQPGNKVAAILRVKGNGFGGEIRAKIYLFLPHDSSCYRHSFL